MVEKLCSFWNGPFSGDILIFFWGGELIMLESRTFSFPLGVGNLHHFQNTPSNPWLCCIPLEVQCSFKKSTVEKECPENIRHHNIFQTLSKPFFVPVHDKFDHDLFFSKVHLSLGFFRLRNNNTVETSKGATKTTTTTPGRAARRAMPRVASAGFRVLIWRPPARRFGPVAPVGLRWGCFLSLNQRLKIPRFRLVFFK